MFKYYRIPDIETAEKIIGAKPTIKFSPAYDLNDPFELKFNLKIDSESEISKELYFKEYPNNNLKDFEAWQNGLTEGFIWQIEQNIRNYSASTYSLACFSESNENNLMWSHYTDNHKGICVEYSNELIEYLKLNESFFASKTVNYSDIPPAVDSFENNQNQVVKIFFNKQSEWKYEREFRILLRCKNQTEFIKIKPEFIKSVYIGSKCDNHISSKIIKLCNMKSIKIYHVITLGKTYKIEFKEQREGTTYIKSFW